jgi:tetratricopeptide (TPR) repeat protein
MYRNPWFTAILGLIVGLVLGYVLAERQPVPPGRALMLGAGQNAGQSGAMPDGHPPVSAADGQANQLFQQQVTEIQNLLAANPTDPGLMTALGNLYFDASRWQEAEIWYKRALEGTPDDPNIITDLAVVYRNLKQPQRSLELLDRAIGIRGDHWQAWYNKVVILQFDLHDHDQAASALRTLQQLRVNDPSIPDLSGLEKEVLGQ